MTRDDVVAALERAADFCEAEDMSDAPSDLLRALANALREGQEKWRWPNEEQIVWIIPEPKVKP